MSNEELVSPKEARIATAIQTLPEQERAAYKYFIRSKQPMVAQDLADELLSLYIAGATCDEIRKLKGSLGLGQIVACRIAYDWDNKRDEYRVSLTKEVPNQAAQTHLETVDFLSDLLAAVHKRYGDKLRQYLLTGDEKLLDGLPFPKNLKDLTVLTDLFMKATGADKKRVEVSGNVTHSHVAQQMTAVDADAALAGLLEEIPDAEIVEPK